MGHSSHVDDSNRWLFVRCSITTSGFHPPISCIYETGIVTDEVNAILKNRKVDLIVMGTHASSGLKHLLLGNHTRYMIDAATVPLLLVPDEIEISKIHWIAFATDFSSKELATAAQLIELAKVLNLEIILMHVMDKNYMEAAKTEQTQNTFLRQLHIAL